MVLEDYASAAALRSGRSIKRLKTLGVACPRRGGRQPFLQSQSQHRSSQRVAVAHCQRIRWVMNLA